MAQQNNANLDDTLRSDGISESKDNLAVSLESQSSGEPVHDGRHPEARFTSRRSQSLSSASIVNDIGLHRLTLDGGSGRVPVQSPGRYVHPHIRGDKVLDDTRATQFHQRDNYRGSRFRAATYNYSKPFGATHRTSQAWVSSEAQAQQQLEEEFLIVRNSMRRLFAHSEVAKWKLADYLAHRQEMIDLRNKKLGSRAQTRKALQSPSYLTISPETQDLLRAWGLSKGNFDQQGNCGRVLGEKTIWCTDWKNGKEEVAPWPTLAEMKWEGDDRAKTNVGRFLPLPRELGPASLAWNQLPVVEQYPMDQINKIPTMEDIYLPVDQEIEEEMEYLWSKKLDTDIWASLTD